MSLIQPSPKTKKKRCANYKQQMDRINTERQILQSKAGKHPFIVSLMYTFETHHKLYMIMEFIQGGDFYTFLDKHKGKNKLLPEDSAKFYLCEITLAIDHLHKCRIIYRDLKPENILLDKDGHVKIVDFGLSRSFDCRPPSLSVDWKTDTATKTHDNHRELFTKSFCGTEIYMAPEMLLRQVYNKSVDWWCLGLLGHEMLTGKHPFIGSSHHETLSNMISRHPNLDHQNLSNAARDFVSKLLVKDTNTRLGCCSKGVQEMECHLFYNNLSWKHVLEKRVLVPCKPNVTGPTDISNFEEMYTNEKAVDSVVSNCHSATAYNQKFRTRKWLAGIFRAFDMFAGGMDATQQITTDGNNTNTDCTYTPAVASNQQDQTLFCEDDK
mmetsp:Transcript_46183/g.68120  ORF Transcript_46183/g.68120 Transcript_46183/m.68120 type:complete len:381 (-) Transcript_46183:2-1144(-)